MKIIPFYDIMSESEREQAQDPQGLARSTAG